MNGIGNSKVIHMERTTLEKRQDSYVTQEVEQRDKNMGSTSDTSVGSQLCAQGWHCRCLVIRMRTEFRDTGKHVGLASHRTTNHNDHHSTRATTKAGKSKAACLTQCPGNPKRDIPRGKTGRLLQTIT